MLIGEPPAFLSGKEHAGFSDPLLRFNLLWPDLSGSRWTDKATATSHKLQVIPNVKPMVSAAADSRLVALCLG
jgi:hypothetical protein